MSAVYDLASLEVSTRFEHPAELIEVPATLKLGREVPLWLCSGAVPAPRRLLRLYLAEVMVGFRLAHRGALRVRLALVVDEMADDSWLRARDAARLLAEDPDQLSGLADPLTAEAAGSAPREGVADKVRVIEVSAQGVSRATAVLAHSGAEPVGRHQVDFDVEAEDLAEGRLLLELTSPADASPLGPTVADAGAVGCAVGWVQLEALPSGAALQTLDGRLSTGAPDGVVTHGVVAVGPSRLPRPVRLAPTGKGRTGNGPAPRAVDLAGRDVPAEVRREDPAWLVTLPPSEIPSYVLLDTSAPPPRLGRFGRGDQAVRWTATTE